MKYVIETPNKVIDVNLFIVNFKHILRFFKCFHC